MVSWGQDAPSDGPLIGSNVAALLRQLAADAPSRVPPDIRLTHAWHRAIYTNVSSVPGPHFLGAFRGSAHADLAGYDVALSDRYGRVVAVTPPAGQVAQHLQRLQRALTKAVSSLDSKLPVGTPPQALAELEAVVMLAAVIHGEWVKVHPYANGNGRTARVWANWVALRYGVPLFVRIKPRPDGLLYPKAAHASMATPPHWIGDHDTTFSVFLDMLTTNPGH